MTVTDVMTRNVEFVRPEEPIRSVGKKMADRNVGLIPVCDGDRLIGVITDRDLAIRAVGGGLDPDRTGARQLMTGRVTYCYEDDDLVKTIELMRKERIRRILVVDRNKRLAGVVSLGDLARHLQQDSAAVLQEISNAPPQT